MPQFARRKRYNKITGLENTKDSKITRQNKIKKPDLSIESGKDHEEAQAEEEKKEPELVKVTPNI